LRHLFYYENLAKKPKLILDLGKPACPDGWFLNGFSCYKAIEQAKSWSNAKQDCHASGGYLMKIDDASEQDFLEVYLIITGINQAAKVSMQMNRNVNALNATDVPSTLRRGNFKTEVSL